MGGEQAGLRSWLPVDPASDFSLYNLPFGIFSARGEGPRPGIAIGDQILDLRAMSERGLLGATGVPPVVLEQPVLNDFIRLGKSLTVPFREHIQQMLCDPDSALRQTPQAMVPMASARLHLPVQVPNYTDFYASLDHARNVGTMFRGADRALMPNWRHLPVAYHGRASSIVPSGTPVRRPWGQVLPPNAERPVFSASQALDIELEVAAVIGRETPLGQPVSTADAEAHVFGLLLLNDWSARDIQRWEYVPLGPFLGKNFATGLSPWIVPLEALAPFRVAGTPQTPPVLPYLQVGGAHHFDIELEVLLTPEGGQETLLSRSNYRYLYWSLSQQVAHHTVNGCNLQVGDLLASGTISGPKPGSYGSLLELTWGGTQPLSLRDGQQRTYVADGDTVCIRGHAQKETIRVGFGSLCQQVLPPIERI